jgi:hypothetical protein
MPFAAAFLGVALFLSVPAAGADSGISGAGAVSEEQQIAALEDEWLAAEVRRDEATIRRIIDDRYTVNHADGSTSGKEDYIADILSSVMTSASITERTVLVDGDTAVTFGTVNVESGEGKASTSSSSRYTLVYVRREGQWRALAFHISKRLEK